MIKHPTIETSHRIYYRNSQSMAALADRSVDLVVTSPPYPMIEMWDEIFGKLDSRITKLIAGGDGAQAFERMHAQLDTVWREVERVLKPGGLACINIGDATRSLHEHFQLFANHARITHFMLSLGLTQLPAILWRKPTNSPNKFMGSGMLPPNAYVTLEHEYVLIFRKKGIRKFTTAEEKELRRAGAYFWEERNTWFSDVWFDLAGTTQKMAADSARKRSGAYPFELARRLILMFSVKGDTLLDPFLGTGTSLHAAICTGRNSIGFEIDRSLKPVIEAPLATLPQQSVEMVAERLAAHARFVQERTAAGKEIRHYNSFLESPVITSQEKNLRLEIVQTVVADGKNRFKVHLAPWQDKLPPTRPVPTPLADAAPCPENLVKQLDLF